MSSFLWDNRFILGGFILFEIIFTLIANGLFHSLDTPISLAPIAAVERRVTIVMPDEYVLYLMLQLGPRREYSFTSSLREREIPFSWSLGKGGSVIRSGTTGIFNGSLSSSEEYGIELFREKLGFGSFILKVEALKPMPDLQELNPRLVLFAHPKSSASWQRELFNIIGLSQMVIVPAFLAIIGLRIFSGKKCEV